MIERVVMHMIKYYIEVELLTLQYSVIGDMFDRSSHKTVSL